MKIINLAIAFIGLIQFLAQEDRTSHNSGTEKEFETQRLTENK